MPIDRGDIVFGSGARPQMVFQDAGASLTPWLTVGELVGERLREEGLTREKRAERVADALNLVGLLPEVAHAKVSQLSGGQRQRVALARATVVPPEVLLCDEPTSALDVSLAATVLNLLGRLRRQLGMAMLFVTHDLAAARIVADRIAVMYLGRIVEEGPAEVAGRRPEPSVHPSVARGRARVRGSAADWPGSPRARSGRRRAARSIPGALSALDDCRAHVPVDGRVRSRQRTGVRVRALARPRTRWPRSTPDGRRRAVHDAAHAARPDADAPPAVLARVLVGRPDRGRAARRW